MAQLAVPVKTDMTELLGISPVWAKHFSQPTALMGDLTFLQFFLAIGIKDIVPNDLLADPVELADELAPQ